MATSTLSDADLVAMVEAYQIRLNAIADQAAAMVRDVFLSLPEIRDAFLAEFEREARTIVDAARLEGADLATAIVAELAGEMPKGKVLDLTFDAVAYDAPFLRTWHRLHEGDAFADARLSGASQAEIIGSNAAHDGASRRMENTGLKLVGARRVVSPGACQWCAIVSIQRYTSIAAASFGHGGHGNKKNCKCTVVGIYGKRDPGRTLNKRRLAELKQSGAIDQLSKSNKARRNRELASSLKSASLPAGTDTTDPRVQALLNLKF